MSSKQINTELFPLNCPACDKYYIVPVILPCLHTICSSCASDSEAPSCPVCAERYAENGRHGSGYPQDILLTNITAIKNAIRVYKENDERMLCKSCCLVPTSTATNFCVECEVFICNFDTTAHVRFGSGKHNFVNLSALLSSPVSELIPNNPFIKCANHPSTHIEYICTQCDKLMCEDCSKLYHKDHPLHPSGSFIMEQSKSLEEKAKNLESKYTKLYQEEYDKQKNNLEMQKERLLSSVDRDFDNLVYKLNERKNNLIYSIISQHDERIKLLEAVYVSNQLLNEKTKDCLEKIQEYTVTYPTKYILPLAQTLMHRLDELEFHDPNLDFDISKVEYKVGNLFEMLNQFEKIGEVNAIRAPKFQNPIVTFPKDMLRSEWIDSENDTEELTLVSTAVTVHNYLLIVFKVDSHEAISVSSPPFSPDESDAIGTDSNFRITIFDPYSPTTNQFNPKSLAVKSVVHMYTNNHGQTYLVDRVGKQLVRLDQFLDIELTISHNEQTHLLEDPVCISFDRTNMNLMVYNQLTNNVNIFDTSLKFLRNFEILLPTLNRFSRSSSEIQRQPVSPRPRSKTSAGAFFPPEIHSPVISEYTMASINLAVNSKETVFFVPNTKHALFVLDSEGNLLKEICLKDSTREDSSANTNSQKHNSLDRKSLSVSSPSFRPRKRSYSNPKRSEQQQQPPRENKPNFTTFICINANDNVYIHQDNEVYIFNSDLEIIMKETVPESYNPRVMNVDFFGHIFYVTNDSILLC